MKSLLLGIVAIIIIGIGGLVYRNIVEHPQQPIACPMDAMICPDGTSVVRTGSSCTFTPCLPPNVTFENIGISFAVPIGFVTDELPDAASVAAYKMSATSSTEVNNIVIRRYEIIASSTALETIQRTAISGTSGLPVPITAFTSTILGTNRFTIVSIGRFEGVVDTAYYLVRGTDVLRFDAIDRGVDWTNLNLDVSTLSTHKALVKLLTTLQMQ